MTEQYGLMDATGKSLAAWLQREYGDEMGLTFEAHDGVGWATVASFRGQATDHAGWSRLEPLDGRAPPD